MLTEPSEVEGAAALAEPLPSRRERVVSMLFPAGTRLGRIEAAVVVVVCWAVAYLRVGWAAGWRGTVWAEDGSVFVTQALTHGIGHSFFTQYAGYWHFVPRVLAAVVTQLPIVAQGLAISMSAALVQALLALLAYVATSGYVPSRPGRGLLALYVVAVPVAPEVTDSIANLQWFLLFGAGVALLWTPRTRWGWLAIAVVVFSACGSSPFAAVIFAAAAVRAVLQRGRRMLAVLAAAAVAFGIQTAVMIEAPPRTGTDKLHSAVHVPQLLSSWLRRIAGDGVLGWHRQLHQDPRGITTGILIGLAVVIIAALLAWRSEPRRLVPPALLMLTSVLIFCAEQVLSGSRGLGAVGFDRYFVTGALYFGMAFLAVVVQAIAAVRLRGPVTVLLPSLAGAAIGVALLVALGIGAVSSWYTGGPPYHRAQGPGWSQGVRQARQACQGQPGSAEVLIPISPGRTHWRAKLTCAIVR